MRANALLRPIAMQTALLAMSPLGDIVAGLVALASQLPNSWALLFGRDSVGVNLRPSFRTRNSYNLNGRVLLRSRGEKA